MVWWSRAVVFASQRRDRSRHGGGMSVAGAATRLAPDLLRHVTLLLAMWGGAGLVTGARLKWDPSTYVIVRAVLPREYSAAAVLLPGAAAALLALGHLALAALRAASRPLLLLYAALMGALLAAEAALVAWARARAAAWLASEGARHLAEALEVREHIQPLLQYFGKWHPLPNEIKALIEEAEADLPCNLYVGAAAGALLAALQLAAVLLALLAARGARGASGAGGAGGTQRVLALSRAGERAPLKGSHRAARPPPPPPA